MNTLRVGWKQSVIAFLWASLLLAVTLLCDNSLPEAHFTPKMHAFAFGGAAMTLGMLWLGFDRRLLFDVPALAVTAFIFYLVLRGISCGESFYYLSYKFFAWFFFMSAHSLTGNERRLLDPAVAIVGAVQAVIVILQGLKLCGGYMTFGQPGMFDNPAGSALCLAMALPFCLGMICNGGSLRSEESCRPSKRMRAAGYVCAALILAGIVFTDSRAGFISALICIVAVMMALQPALRSRRVIFLLAVAAVVVGIALFFYKKDSASGRIFIWRNTVEVSLERPLFGHGHRSFQRVYMPQQAEFFAGHPESPAAGLSNDVFSPFSEFLRLLCEYGFTGLVLLAAAVFFLLREGRRRDFLSLLVVAVFVVFASVSYPLRYSYGYLVLLYVLSSFSGRTLAALRRTPLVCATCSALVVALLFPVLRDNCFRRDWKSVQDRYHADYVRLSESGGSAPHLDGKEIDDYMSLYVRHCYGNDFLYDFALKLMQHGKYEGSLSILEEFYLKGDEYVARMLSGADYQYLRNYDKAAEHYAVAHDMVPCRFLPLYFLMQCYDLSGDWPKALETAVRILEMPVKVPSKEVSTAQSVARQVVAKYGGNE